MSGWQSKHPPASKKVLSVICVLEIDGFRGIDNWVCLTRCIKAKEKRPNSILTELVDAVFLIFFSTLAALKRAAFFLFQSHTIAIKDYRVYYAMNIYGRLFDPQKTLDPLDENFNRIKFEESPQIDNVYDMIGKSKEQNKDHLESRRKKKIDLYLKTILIHK